MPQSDPTLHAFWENDGNALDHLRPNFTFRRGMIRQKDPAYVITFVDLKAVQYLCDEWDYGVVL